MFRGVRARLTATVVFLVVLTAIVLGVAAYLFVDARLHDQELTDAGNQARFDLSVITPSRLGDPPTDEQLRAFALAFQGRGLETIVVPSGGEESRGGMRIERSNRAWSPASSSVCWWSRASTKR